MQKKAAVAVMVSGGGTNLQALIDAKRQGKMPHGEIRLVISNKADAFALQRAEKNQIPTVVIQKRDCADQAEFENRIKEQLALYRIDLIVLAGFMSILSADFTACFPERILNVHPSLIPSFCGKGFYGLRVHEEALRRGVKLTGATVHFVNEIPDGGRILLQKAVRVYPGDTPEKLQARVMRQAEWKILPQAVEETAKSITEKGEADGNIQN